MSFVYAHLGDSVNALFYLKRAIALEPEEEEETVNYICSELLLHENYDTAQKILEHTLNAYPNNMELRFQMVIGHVDNPLQKRVMRRQIARLNTLIHMNAKASASQGAAVAEAQ